MSTPLVMCENLVKIYKVQEANVEVVALQGLDLEVERGEMLALVGQSGSGKTTLLNVLGALDVPSAGRCTVAGNDLTRLDEKRRNEYRRFVTGHVWQQSGRNLIPDLTALDNVSLPQLLGGVGAGQRERRSRELLNLVGLGDMTRRYPNALSGGEQQRAAIAVALANEPDLLLADEPTGELDSTTAHEILALLRKVNDQLGLTIILVTHDVTIAADLDRTIAIRDGKTSTETVRRDAPLRVEGELARMASAIIGLPGETHRESVLIDRVGRLQLPEEALHRVAFNGRAEVRSYDDHVEIWPLGDGK
ncbi:MAG TPA: ABC transporter ATP-binding protein [Ktedonobacterales bacterium]|nr:ABC transporter ATP-binding protein [Ktedonobacterales bacterium]